MRHALMLFALAFKNLTRHKRRTVITALSLAIGLCMFVLFDSLLTGMENDGVRSMIQYDTGGLQVQHEDYWNDKDLMPLDKAIADPAAVMEYLASKKLASAPRAVFSGELILNKDPWPESGSVRARFYAVDPVLDRKVFRLEETVKDGKWLESGVEGIVIGSLMASDLGAKVGYPVTIVTRTFDGAYQTLDFPVMGILSTPNAAVNRFSVFMSLDVADEYLMLGGKVNQIAVAFDEERDAAAMAKTLSDGLKAVEPDLVVLPWSVTGADFLAFVQSRQGLSGLIMVLVFIIAAVGVSNTMLLTILERTREMGMLRAQGLHDSELTVSLLMESAAIGMTGGVFGLVLSLPFNVALIRTGIDLGYLVDKIGVALPFSGILRGAWHPLTMIKAFVMGTVLSVVVSVIPVRRAMRMGITECLRHN